MATFSENLRATLIVTGDETGTWGSTANDVFDHIDNAFGFKAHAMADANETITMADGADSDARYMVLDITGAWLADRTLTLAPNTLKKMWVLINSTTGGFDLIVSQGSGAKVTIAPGDGAMVYANGGGAGAIITNALASMTFTNIVGTNITGLIATATQGTVDHDSLANYVADQHVAHAGVTLTAGTGLGGGGTIASNRTFNLTVDTLSERSGALTGADRLTGTNGATNFSETISGIDLGIFNNDQSWTSSAGTVTTVTAGTGLSGGGTPTPTINFDAASLGVGGTLEAGDHLIAANGSASNKQLISVIPLGIFNNDQGWTSSAGTVTSVGGGTGISSSGGATPSLALTVDELSEKSGDLVGTDRLVGTSGSTNFAETISGIPLSLFDNDLGGGLGTVTSVDTGAGLSGGIITTTGTISVQFSGLTASGTLIGTDDLVTIDGSNSRKTQIDTINLGIFINNVGWTTNVGTVTSVGTGDGLSGGAITTSGTLTVDSTVIRTTGNQTLGGTKTFSSTISGSINGSSASCTGNSVTATTATTATNVAASGITGSTLASGVTASSLQSLGTITSLRCTNLGVNQATGNAACEITEDDNNQRTLIVTNDGNSTPLGIHINFPSGNPNDTTSYFVRMQSSTGAKAWIYSNGDMQNVNNIYAIISDVKLKQDIVDSGSQWDDLKAMRFRKFRFKDQVEQNGDDAIVQLGVVAQEMQSVSPGLVFMNGDGVLGVKASILYMKGMVALQEALGRIEVLEAKVN